MEQKTDHPQQHVIHYIVDTEPQTTTEKVLTPVEILRNAGFDPATHYLVQVVGKERISYKDEPNKKIEMHDGMKFIAVSTKPTPVS